MFCPRLPIPFEPTFHQFTLSNHCLVRWWVEDVCCNASPPPSASSSLRVLHSHHELRVQLLTKPRCAQATGTTSAKENGTKKKDEVPLEVTPLEKMLQNVGPLREDGSDRFYGFENVRSPTSRFLYPVPIFPSMN
jgi:hypothetical protein